MDHLGFWDCADSAEDAIFYEEMRRQVLLLTAEDDDEYQENKHPNMSEKSLQQRVITSPVSALQTQQPGCYYYQWSGGEATDSVPIRLFNVWNPGSGTGVFIPQIVKSRRRNKPKKKNNERGRTYKAVANVAL